MRPEVLAKLMRRGSLAPQTSLLRAILASVRLLSLLPRESKSQWARDGFAEVHNRWENLKFTETMIDSVLTTVHPCPSPTSTLRPLPFVEAKAVAVE